MLVLLSDDSYIGSDFLSLLISIWIIEEYNDYYLLLLLLCSILLACIRRRRSVLATLHAV